MELETHYLVQTHAMKANTFITDYLLTMHITAAAIDTLAWPEGKLFLSPSSSSAPEVQISELT
ncbi:unnamed protein product [marine sediment metagenome]|uniref:Uncharacterized protein n=1 Tax=marine sediment metagenome TaxID=412755 RepID=X0TU34_9ZZZZ